MSFSLRVLVLASFATLPLSSGAWAAPADDLAAWLKSVGAKLDSKEPSAALVATATTVDFDAIAANRLVPADLAKLAGLARLNTVGLGNKAGSDAAVAALAKAVPQLEALRLHASAITDAGLADVAKLVSLRNLSLFNTRITAVGLASIAKLTKLERLDISGTNVGDAGLAALRPSPVRHLSYNTMKGVTKAGIAALAALPRLLRLDLQFAEIDGELGELGASKTLEGLGLMSSRISDTGGVALARITTLKDLYIWKTKITDKTLKALSALKGLRNLYVSETPVTDAGLASLAVLPALETLWAEKTPFGKAASAAFGKHAKIRWLKLDETQVDDASLAVLGGAPALTTLGLRKTTVTAAGVDAIKARLPRLMLSK
ncbi:MAG: hypothetical protein JNJ59_17600 [Deltaproteobacteria bacterium]|nr:hypothetical protein [Deltaproteobacteria bacterium]